MNRRDFLKVATVASMAGAGVAVTEPARAESVNIPRSFNMLQQFHQLRKELTHFKMTNAIIEVSHPLWKLLWAMAFPRGGSISCTNLQFFKWIGFRIAEDLHLPSGNPWGQKDLHAQAFLPSPHFKDPWDAYKREDGIWVR